MGIEERTQQIGIRPYQQKDKQAVRGICIATSGLPVETQRQKEPLLLQYCDYYLEQEPEALDIFCAARIIKHIKRGSAKAICP